MTEPKLAISTPPGLVSAEIDEYWMQQALLMANYAQELGEVPVGAVIVHNNQLIASGYNQSIQLNDPTAHAEMQALRAAAKDLQNYRLPGCTLYVTLEPCAMCSAAMVHARVERLVFGAFDPKTGAAGSVLNLVQYKHFNHKLDVVSGVLQAECSSCLSSFFQQRRQQKAQQKQLDKTVRCD